MASKTEGHHRPRRAGPPTHMLKDSSTKKACRHIFIFLIITPTIFVISYLGNNTSLIYDIFPTGFFLIINIYAYLRYIIFYFLKSTTTKTTLLTHLHTSLQYSKHYIILPVLGDEHRNRRGGVFWQGTSSN